MVHYIQVRYSDSRVCTTHMIIGAKNDTDAFQEVVARLIAEGVTTTKSLELVSRNGEYIGNEKDESHA